MKNKAARKYVIFIAGITLTAIVSSLLPFFKAEPDCVASQGQTVVKWKDMYWSPCKYSWNGYCLWPIRRKHSTYKVTVHEGILMRDESGMPIPMAGGKIRNWGVQDAAAWNGLENFPNRMRRYENYEPIADNEYVVMVETRYRLFHKVEDNLRLCTKARTRTQSLSSR